MVIISLTTFLWIQINLVASLDPLDLHFGPKNAQKSVFISKIEAQGQWFRLKTILFDSIKTFLWIPINLVASLNPLDLHFGPKSAQKCPKISIYFKNRLDLLDLYFWSKTSQKSAFSFKNGAQGEWFGLETILIGYISGYYISNDFSMNSNKFNRLTGPSWP